MGSLHDYYESLAPNYDRDRFANSYGQYVDGMERGILTRWLRCRAVESVVELGCGTGRFLNYAMTGIDSSAAMLSEAEKKWPDRTLHQADAAHTGLEIKGFDAALCFHVLMHLDEASCSEIFREAARLVRPGGSFIFDIPSKPRRALSGRQSSGWHGSMSASLADIQAWSGGAWRLKRWRGILFFPVHHIPTDWRKSLAPLDRLICSTPLARWASYYVCEFEREKHADVE